MAFENGQKHDVISALKMYRPTEGEGWRGPKALIEKAS